MLKLRLAGRLRFEGADIEPPASRRARGVLAYLALHPGPHSRAQVAARFWPDVLDESARTSLRAALSELRRALGPAAAHVVATRETVVLDDGLWVDTRAFDAALARGDAAAALDACSSTILDGFEDDWAHEARQAHAHRLARALEQLAASAIPAEAVRLTREQVALDPLAEEPNRRLIERLAAAGDRAAALAAGERFAERLRSTLAIAPSRETRALLDAIRSDRPAVAAPAILAREPDFAFVGRARELDRLRASWADVEMHRTRRMVAIAGEPGIGKTRLARQFAQELQAGGALVLLGRCWEEPLAPFEPYAEALRQADADAALRPGSERCPRRAPAPVRCRRRRARRGRRCPGAAARPRRPALGRPRHAPAHELPAALAAARPVAAAGHLPRHRARPRPPAGGGARGPAPRRRPGPRRAARAGRGGRRRARSRAAG